MKKILYIVLALLCSCCGVSAQEFTEIDWNSLGNDTLLPVFGCQQVLGSEYKGFDYSAAVEYPELEPVTEQEMERWGLERYRGLLGDSPEVSAQVSSSRRTGYLDLGFIPLVERDGSFYKIKSFKFGLSRTLSSAVSAKTDNGGRYTWNSVLSSGYWYKIRVSSSGVYRLTRKALASMGFQDPSKVRLYGYGGAVLDEINLEKMPDDMCEIPLWRDGENILFYAKGPLSWKMNSSGLYEHNWNTYSEYGYYFLTANDTVAPLSVPVAETVAAGNARIVETFPDYALYENDAFSWFQAGRRFYDGYDFVNGATKNYDFNLEGLANDTVRMTVSFSTDGSALSELRASVNGVSAGSLVINEKSANTRASVSSTTFLCRNMFSPESKVELKHIRQDGMSGRLDYIRLNFTRTLALRGASSDFRTGKLSGNCIFRIKSPVSAIVWRVGQSGDVCVVPSSMENGYCVTSAVVSGSTDEYVVLDPDAAFPEPEIAGPVSNQNLHGYQPAEMVVIVPSGGKLTAQAERLAEAHMANDSMSVLIVTAGMIYNEFSSGTPDATAYRRFLKMLYDRDTSGKTFRYLLLFGGGAWDNRMITQDWTGVDPDDYLLCYEADNSISETKSYVAEDYFALLEDGKGSNVVTQKVDIGVGRFPVVTADEAKAMVDKTISYMNGEYAGSWQNKVLIVGDDGDNNIHMEQADEVARELASMNSSLNIRKIYWDSYEMEVSASGNRYPLVRKELLRQLDEGALFVNYTGHGSPDVLSHELVLNKADFSSMTSPRVAFWLTASCDITPFDAPYEMIGKNALLNPVGGALAMLTTTRTVFSSYNQSINILFSRNLMNSEYRLGDVLRVSKVQLVTPSSKIQDYSENKLNYVLLGDPALSVTVPVNHIIVDSLRTGLFKDGKPIASAGGHAVVKGHIIDDNGNLLTDFNGTINSVVYDSERHIITRNNAGSAKGPFEYDDYDRLLYSGNDSVKNGLFSFEFPVPKDINYSNKTGKIVLHAQARNGWRANGNFRNFIVGETSPTISADSLGPDISLYLNTPLFKSGDNVNTTPCFVAEISDDDGINYFGNGVGHDIMLMIDNDPGYTYVMNSYYSTVDDDYRKGRVVFSLPKLTEGRHTLLFRAWDVLNNATTLTVDFNVVDGLEPELFSVRLSDNPARTHTSFIVSHDRPGSLVSVCVQVTDTKGRLVWTDTSVDSSGNNISFVDWNLFSSGGQRLMPGIYIYRLTLTDSDGAAASATGKIVIL